MRVRNHVAVTDAGDTLIEGGPFIRVTLEVFGADVLVAFRPVAADQMEQAYDDDLFVPRGVHSFGRRCDGVRVKNAVPGIYAKCTIAGYARRDRG